MKEIRKKLDDPRISPYTPVPVAFDVGYDKLAYVSEHREDFPGVRAEPMAIRSYVNGGYAAHVLGYTGEINEDELKAQQKSANYELGDDIGKNGVELTYESDLRGTPGKTRVEVDATGRVLRTLSTTPPKPGKDVKLTIDLDVQRVAEDSLAQGIFGVRSLQDKTLKTEFKKFKAPAGAAVVLDATTGSVVAMASFPSYDPNQFTNGISTPLWQQLNDPNRGYPLIDRAIGGQYAPGSTFKLITAIAGQQAGLINPTKTIDDKGTYAYPTDPGQVFRNDNSARVRAGRAPEGDHRVERRVLLHDRRRPLLQPTPQPARRERAAGHRSPVRLREALRRSASQRGHWPRARCCVEGEDPRRQPAGVPVSRLAAGRQHPLRGRPGRHAHDAAPARERLRRVRERRDALRASRRVRGGRRRGQEGA